MAQLAPFVAFVALLLINTSYCSADKVYCVIPTQPNATSCSLCPPNSIHCSTLSEYAQEAETYLVNTSHSS